MTREQVLEGNEILNKIRELRREFSIAKDSDGFEKDSYIQVVSDCIDFDNYKVRLSQKIDELENKFKEL